MRSKVTAVLPMYGFWDGCDLNFTAHKPTYAESNMKYKPTNRDKEFARELVRVMAHNGTWVCPALEQTFRVNKDAMRIELVNGPTEMMDIHTAVFKSIGYAIVDARPHMNN